MSGHRDFNELLLQFTPERQARVDAKKAKLIGAIPLRELRTALAMTQKELADTLDVNQPAVAKLENRADMHVSSLRSYVEALGGRLSIVAEFPQGDVTIDLDSDLNKV